MYEASAPWMPPWLARHWDRVSDVTLAAALLMITLTLQPWAQTTRLIVVSAVFSVVAALLRRRYPVGVLATATAVTIITLLTDHAVPGLFVTIGALTYAAALHSPRRRPWFYARTVWLSLVAAGLITDYAGWWGWHQIALFAFFFGGAGAGDSVRMRRAYIQEVTERARQAEQTREQEAQRRVIDERLRIARELHDVVAHHIAVISVHAGAAGHVLRNDPEKVWPVLEHIRGAADTVLEEIKSVISVLRDPDEVSLTEPLPGLDRLDDLLGSLRTAGFAVRSQQRGEARPLPAITDLAAYRIVQEALTNAHRYGDGDALLDIEYDRDAVTIQVTNRTAWPGPRRSGSGYGLLGMRERAAVAHGTIMAGPLPGGWFRVRAVLPVGVSASERILG
ncbi:histidine kinase [Actinoplanes missouriensis]|uniref:sensor histidine kinase n=1 Tax=Actinoplanes missouriensis TaxID=1866 RepID=UPI00340DE311